jgi:hypothetical protein
MVIGHLGREGVEDRRSAVDGRRGAVRRIGRWELKRAVQGETRPRWQRPLLPNSVPQCATTDHYIRLKARGVSSVMRVRKNRYGSLLTGAGPRPDVFSTSGQWPHTALGRHSGSPYLCAASGSPRAIVERARQPGRRCGSEAATGRGGRRFRGDFELVRPVLDGGRAVNRSRNSPAGLSVDWRTLAGEA